MADQTEKQPEQKRPDQKKPDMQELYGKQGNEGQYGLGQYDSEGKPDPHGLQAQQIQPDSTVEEQSQPDKAAHSHKKSQPEQH